MNEPIICFGQQPSGFFPKRYLVAKINTAKKLQAEIGGRVVFFYHDSDADYRETITIMHDKSSGVEVRLNFLQENKIQKKYSPLYAKRVPEGWKEEIKKQLPRFVSQETINTFMSVEAKTAADFCLDMYTKLGLLDGIEVMRSGDHAFRLQASDLTGEYFADVQYEGETVRAQLINNKLQLHEGGGKYTVLPDQPVEKWQKNPARDQRFGWMQAVIKCTHYIAGNSEHEYLDKSSFPEVAFVKRDDIDQAELAWINNN